MPAKTHKLTIFVGKTVVSPEVDALASAILGKDYRPDFVLAAPSGHYGRLVPSGRKATVWLIPRKDNCIRVIFRMPTDATDAATGKTFKPAGCRPCDGRDWQIVAASGAANVAAIRKLIAATYTLHGVKGKPASKPASRKPASKPATAAASATTDAAPTAQTA